jgi:hypothetical protein
MMVVCQGLAARPVRSDITCLTCVYSSKEYADMSLPYPDAFMPPWGISEMIGMWSLIQTAPAWKESGQIRVAKQLLSERKASRMCVSSHRCLLPPRSAGLVRKRRKT